MGKRKEKETTTTPLTKYESEINELVMVFPPELREKAKREWFTIGKVAGYDVLKMTSEGLDNIPKLKCPPGYKGEFYEKIVPLDTYKMREKKPTPVFEFDEDF